MKNPVLTTVMIKVQMIPSAASSGATPFCHISNMVTATTCELGPASSSGIDTALDTIRNTNSQHVTTAGATNGTTMRRNVVTAPAPESAEASSSSRWICSTPA